MDNLSPHCKIPYIQIDMHTHKPLPLHNIHAQTLTETPTNPLIGIHCDTQTKIPTQYNTLSTTDIAMNLIIHK